MPIKLLAEIRVEHPFYATGLCAGARIVPEESTMARLRGLRLVAKETVGGLRLLADLAEDGAALVPIPQAVLRFYLMNLPVELAEVTDLGGIAPGTVFTDAGSSKAMKPKVEEAQSEEVLAKPKGTVAMVLSGRPVAEAKPTDFSITRSPQGIGIKAYDPASNNLLLEGPAGDVAVQYPVAPRAVPGTMAAIEIGIGPDLAVQAAKGKPRHFTVALKPAAARWCYHLVTDLSDPLAKWRITHPAADGPAVEFGGSGLKELDKADAGDPFGSELLSRSAPLRVLRFLSDQPVACSEKRARRLALFAGDRQLFSALPNPPPTNVRLVGGQPAFGEVLRFVTA